MKKPIRLSYFFLVVAILLELLSRRKTLMDLRLFVGVFIVLSLAFMIYSIEEQVKVKGKLLFSGKDINDETIVKAQKNEYYLEAGKEYLWIKNSVFLDWGHTSEFGKFVLGIAATIGGQRVTKSLDEYIVFTPIRDVFVLTSDMDHALQTGVVHIDERGLAQTHYAKSTIYGMLFTLMVTIILILSLLAYILVQLF